jgi:hypothetical protein
MVTFIEPLSKAFDKIRFGWNPEPVSGVQGYNVYVGQTPNNLSLLASNVSPIQSSDTPFIKKIPYCASIYNVTLLLGISTTYDFSTLRLYWAITYIDATGTESSITLSKVVEVPPVGINPKTKREDPVTNRNMYIFSDELQKWIKGAGSESGAFIVDTCDYFKANVTSVYTRDTSGNVLTLKSYLSDMTTPGSPAKLTTYSYTSGYVSKVVVVDSTV